MTAFNVMNHLTLLQNSEYIRWNQEQARTDYVRKIHLDHLRHWWRHMADAFPDHLIPAGQLPDPATLGEPDDTVPGMAGVTIAAMCDFADAINRLSQSHGLPAPFERSSNA